MNNNDIREKYELEVIYLYTNIAIFSILLNCFYYCYLILIILFNINHLFADSEVVPSIVIYH